MSEATESVGDALAAARAKVEEARADGGFYVIAISLRDLYLAHRDRGGHEDALRAVEEEVELRRQVTAALARSTEEDVNQYVVFYDRDISEQIDAPPREGRLRREHESAFELGRALCNLGTTLTDLGRAGEGLAAFREGWPLCLEVARQQEYLRPALDRPGERFLLALLGGKLYEEALPVIGEMVTLERAQSEGKASAPTAAWLAEQGRVLSELGRLEEAVEVLREATAMYEEVDGESAHLAAAYHWLYLALWDLKQEGAACDALENSIATYQARLGLEPQHRGVVARYLVTLGLRVGSFGYLKEAAEYATEGIEIQRALLAEEASDEKRTDLITFLEGLAAIYRQTEMTEEAAAVDAEAAGLRAGGFGSREVLLQAFRTAQPIDEERFRTDLDAVVDQDAEPTT